MQTILGSNGQIGQELVKELYKNYTHNLRLVSRNPQKINQTDQLMPADLTNLTETNEAIAGSDIVYFTVGLPMNSKMWEEQFPIIVKNVITACITYNCKLVFFDNTYMYEKSDKVQTENSIFAPVGRKSQVRAKIAKMITEKINNHELQAVICRAPEFYGPDKTQSITNTMILNRIKNNQNALVPISDSTLRTLIWTPDASKAMALIGNTPDAYNQVWHLPTSERITYQDLIKLASRITGKKINYRIIKLWQFKLSSVFSQKNDELQELLPRYQVNNIFSSEKFKNRFPDFKITSFNDGISEILLKKNTTT